MASLLQEAFGTINDDTPLDLYRDVLKVAKDCSLAQLRKGYYKQALQYHPDKNPGDTSAACKFQAVSWTYQFLKDPEKRKDYDQDGIVPDNNDHDDDEEEGDNNWKTYFDQIFGKLTTHDIDNFAVQYKMSPEEETDVLKYYEQCKGNLIQMLEYVMLSEEGDVQRWVEDYLQPAIEAKTVPDYGEAIQKALKQVSTNKKAVGSKKKSSSRKPKKEEASGTAIDPDETETEEDENDADLAEMNKQNSAKKNSKSQKKAPPKKTVPKKKAKTASKKKNKAASSEMDLIAAIRNKNRRGGNPLAALASRYGVPMDHDNDEKMEDPLDDAAFDKIQSKLKENQKKKNATRR